MRKMLILFVITVLVLTIIASCGNGQPSNGYTETNDPQDTNETGAPMPGGNETHGEVISPEDLEIRPSSEIITITAVDGYELQGRLTLPGGGSRIQKLVILVNVTGPQTFDARRNFGSGLTNFNDFYATYFQEHGIAFFSYSTRGVSIGGSFPYFHTIDESQFLTNLPSNHVMDIYNMINEIQALDVRLEDSLVILWGHSEGTVISTMFAERFPHMVDALILQSLYVDNMYDILWWRLTGGPTMVTLRHYFDADGDGRISREEFYAVDEDIRESLMGINATERDGRLFIDGNQFNIDLNRFYLLFDGEITLFGLYDINNDGYIDRDDFYIHHEVQMSRNAFFMAIEDRNNTWLAYRTPRVTAEWFLEHFDLPSNMQRIQELNLPIYIFHGTLDTSACVYSVIALQETLAERNNTNVIINILEGYDSNLNVQQYIVYGEMPEGLHAALYTAISFGNIVRN